MASGAERFLLLPGLRKSHCTSQQVPEQVCKLWKTTGLMSKDNRVLFLSPLTSIHVKKEKNMEHYFLTSPCTSIAILNSKNFLEK
jgi:hypothetical protein